MKRATLVPVAAALTVAGIFSAVIPGQVAAAKELAKLVIALDLLTPLFQCIFHSMRINACRLALAR